MMELSHSLTLNEEVLKQIPEAKRPVFVFEWLRFLDKVLVAAQKSDIKGCQKKLVEQLTNQIAESPGPPTRNLIARCLATLFSVGDTFLLFETINKCNDILRNKDDSPSYLPTRLCATTCIGFMYERLGRMMGRSYEETVQILLKPLKNAESQVRCEIMMTLEKVCCGMGTAASSVHKDIYKAARHCMTDRVMAVRCAASKCLLEMLKHAPFLYTVELESLASLCFRSFDGSNYDVRCSVGKMLGVAMSLTQQPSKTPVGKNRMISVEEVLTVLSNGFLRGGTGFLKGGPGDMIKGSSNVIREVRVGVTHAYVEFVQAMGGAWLEHNLTVVLGHILDLVANPKASPSHVDAVYSRKCVTFILRSVLGRMLGEKAQISACKELCQIIIKHMKSLDATADSATVREGSQDMFTSQHALVCALQELGCLVQSLGTTATLLITEPNSGILESIMSVLVHPMPASRLAAAWCLRCICVALPSQLTPLVDRCLNQLETFKSSPETIGGCSVALAALVGVTHKCPLGIPYARGKMIFNIAEDLLRSASQNSRLSLHRTHAGWLLIGSLMTLGPSVVRGLLPRMMLLWRNAFPRSSKELDSEKARGDAFTWQVTLEGRAGALSAMYSFLAHCSDMVTEDVVRRLLTPVESALSMIANISSLIKTYGQHLKASGAMVRLRLYETLSKLPPHSFEGSYNTLLRLLVAEFTLADNPANTTTSFLRAMCHTDDSVILGSWLQETDHKSIEDQLQPNSASGSGALEHDSTTLYKPLAPGEVMPGPLPLGVAVIDMSVVLFGSIFPHVAYKHRYQMLEHFSECLKQTKAARQEAVQINIFTAVLSGLKSLAESKASFGQDDVRKAAINLVMCALTNSNPILRCAAGEALGRMSQVISDSRFTAEMAQNSFDRLKSARDVISRTGHSLALGCIHRYVGGMGSGQHLNTSVSILLALAQDTSSPVVQVWALHALALIADSGGPMFRSYVEPTLSLTLKLLLNVRLANVDVYQCIGKCLSALITAIGPELQGNTNSISTARSSFLCAFAIMQDHYSPLVQAEATACLQQLHMFAPRHVNLSSLVPNLCRTLVSSHLLLRRAAVSCLRQLAQREACEVCEHAMTLAKESTGRDGCVEGLVVTDMGLPGVLFGMLDMETDVKLVSDIHDTLTSMLQALAEDNLGQWLRLCKDVLTTSTDSSGSSEKDSELDGLDNDADDDVHLKAGEEQSSHPAVAPRWPTRVFAAESVRRIISVCEGNKMHFDISLAKDMQVSRSKACDYLVFHLSDLVRMAFIAATSDSDQLRLEGLKTLQVIIDKFAKVPEPEFPGHVILEQFQAQVGAALRPAFSPDTPSHVTAMACQVCSAWIGSGVARDLNDLRRVHQLLVSSLTKLKKSSPAAQLYNESAASLEKLAILKAWAEVYVVAMDRDKESQSERQESNNAGGDEYIDEEMRISSMLTTGVKENLLDLVSPELVSLSKHWLAALKDYALLSLPAEFSSQLPHDGGAFYSADTIDAARPHYRMSWPSILHAAALWLTSGGFDNVANEQKEAADDSYTISSSAGFGATYGGPTPNVKTPDDINVDRFYLVFGICIEALCSPRSTEPLEHIMICLHALEKLLSSTLARSYLGSEQSLGIELCNVIHRLLLMRESVDTQLLMMRIIKLVLKAARENLDCEKKRKLKEMVPANQDQKEPAMEIALLGEGKTSGEIEPGKSVVFAVLEVCLCLLVRNLPHVNFTMSTSMNTYAMHRNVQNAILTEEASSLLATAVSILSDVPPLCSPAGSISVLPTILHLVTSVLQGVCRRLDYARSSSDVLANVIVQCLRSLVSSPFNKDERCKDSWEKLLRSALLKILEINKADDCTNSNKGSDVGTVMMAVAVFVLGASKNIVCVPVLQNKCVQLFLQSFRSQQLTVKLKSAQLLKSIYQHPDPEVTTPYIRAIAPCILEHALSAEAKRPTTDAHYLLASECVQIAELLSFKKTNLLSLVVPLLIQYLVAPTTEEYGVAKTAQLLHDHALQSLMKIGPQFPQQFRTVMSQSPELRMKLEAAVRANQNNNTSKSSTTGSDSDERANRPPPAPSIKLKTDFSNFTG